MAVLLGNYIYFEVIPNLEFYRVLAYNCSRFFQFKGPEAASGEHRLLDNIYIRPNSSLCIVFLLHMMTFCWIFLKLYITINFKFAVIACTFLGLYQCARGHATVLNILIRYI